MSRSTLAKGWLVGACSFKLGFTGAPCLGRDKEGVDKAAEERGVGHRKGRRGRKEGGTEHS